MIAPFPARVGSRKVMTSPAFSFAAEVFARMTSYPIGSVGVMLPLSIVYAR
jgi:hypothetical protein